MNQLIGKVFTKNQKIASMLYGIGNGCMCQLGQEKPLNTHTPIKIDLSRITDKPIKQFSCGCYHTICLTSNNKIITWGVNDEGALGRDTKEEIPEFINESIYESFNGKIKKVVSTGDASFILTTKGIVYATGTFKSSRGVEKLFEEENQKKYFIFTKLKSNVKFNEIVGGNSHILLISTDNHVYGMGSTEYGQLIDKQRLVGLKKLTYKTVNYINKSKIQNAIKLEKKEKVLKIFAGTYSSFIKTNKRIVAFGRNSSEELSVKNGKEEEKKWFEIFKENHKEIIHISSGEGHTLFLNKKGEVFASGNNIFGQLGTGDNKKIEGETVKLNLKEKIKTVKANGSFSVLQTDKNEFISFGLNTSGELGFDSEENEKNKVRTMPFSFVKMKNFSVGNDFIIFDGEIKK